MQDQQVDQLIEVLKDGRIYAVNAGENGEVTKFAWYRLAHALKDTKLGFMFVEVRLAPACSASAGIPQRALCPAPSAMQPWVHRSCCATAVMTL